MATYTLINPHDPYEFDAPDDDVATTLVLLLHHMYGWERDGASAMPGLSDPDSETGKQTLTMAKSVMEHRSAELVDALRSLEIKPVQRKALGVDPDKWHDEMRSSESDPRAHARHIADQLAAKVTA